MKTFREQAAALVAQMTLEEAASQLTYDSPAIERLNVPAYNWWNEALHGVARAGTATVFPQAIALAAIFDETEVFTMARIIAKEARAKYNMQAAAGDRDLYKGLTFWSPNINLFRDPRWGRGQETYGEDPFLTAQLGCAYVTGLQGDGPYMQAAACAKHLAAHSGPEITRHGFDAHVNAHDLWDSYLPAFEALVKKAHVAGVMGAYNRINGEPCCASPKLNALLKSWGFDGYFVGDAWALHDLYQFNPLTEGPVDTIERALPAGCDLDCGDTYLHVMEAYREGKITEKDIRTAAEHLFTIRFALGEFASDCPYRDIPFTEVDTPENNAASLRMSEKSAVLLKNDGLLPLNLDAVHTIGVIGPNANSIEVLRGNYCGEASKWETNLSGIQDYVGDKVRVLYAQGCHLYRKSVMDLAQENDRLSEACAVARLSDVVVLCLGLDPTLEGEQGDAGNEFAAGDKTDLSFPAPQQKLLKAVCESGKPVILVVNSGGAMDLRYAQKHCRAILQVWYSGAHGGTALARLLFGAVVPGGRLPVTFYQDVADLPDFDDYTMAGRTYRYYRGTPLYPFGYGLSYSKFAYRNLKTEAAKIRVGSGLTLEVEVANIGTCDADEVTQVYLRKRDAGELDPIWRLCGFCRTHLAAGETRRLSFTIPPELFYSVAADGSRSYVPGTYTVYVGGHQPDARSFELTGDQVLQTSVELL
ncbi:glycoside hydrolase family 3 C-terminal domain-containing protein [Thermocaproicibacter melissae]|uniref:glycoside hydrolase family 3 C-terminal domain-containing protein n=1 Tax=Thermocaproicibacter melissae TaxID=2966552 RepID=UPI0024B22E6C|nr:glycoside hydrolase family 3 C-terminal domain-containing protein [Thermocaproicibacter melissae]WBY63966.1 glycoside hydrolase family 3 C-terminal domain-containing protein [Thermocaproicibacter melissae]